MEWSILLNQIKREGDFEASTDYDAMILDMVNEVFSEAVKRTNLREQLKVNQSLALATNTQAVSLPSGFLRLAEPRAYYLKGGETLRRLLRPATLRLSHDFNGPPGFFSIALNQFNIFPYGNVTIGDTAILNFYSSITPIEDGSDDVPDSFSTLCKHGALARLLNFKDSKRATFHAAQQREAMIGLIANGATN